MSKPYLKWAGGKHKLATRVLDLLPSGIDTLVEPCAGSASVFLESKFEHGVLCDSNVHLMEVHKAVRDCPSLLLNQVKRLFKDGNDEKTYYRRRDEFNSSPTPWLFMYLNRHGYNGMCRYNSTGGFNIPFGRYDTIYLPEEEVVQGSERLKSAFLISGDFKKARTSNGVRPEGRNVAVYYDPPYVKLTDTSFTGYNGEFGPDDHRRIAVLAEAQANKGCTVIVSNHDTEEARDIYRAASEVHELQVHRSIGGAGAKRGKVGEVMFVYRPPMRRTA